jgi:hypothetical protein
MKYLRILAFICVLGLVMASCVKKENYPDYPVITYNSCYVFCSGSTTDSALLRVNFTDGNGQIGYPQQQEGVAPDFFARPMVYFYATKSYQYMTYVDTAGINDTVTLSYLIPYITPAGTDKELSGIIQINTEGLIQTDISDLYTNFSAVADVYNLEFQVWMYDRNGNKSNVIVTPPVYTCH